MSITKYEQVKTIAQQHGIKTARVKKSDLVRAIQNAEGNEQCFDAGKSTTCGQSGCSWREICS